jgi:hypothetical protein
LKKKLIKLKERIHMSKVEQLKEFLAQVKDCDRLIEEQESLREDLFKRIDEIVESEGIDIISLAE